MLPHKGTFCRNTSIIFGFTRLVNWNSLAECPNQRWRGFRVCCLTKIAGGLEALGHRGDVRILTWREVQLGQAAGNGAYGCSGPAHLVANAGRKRRPEQDSHGLSS